MPGFIVKRQIDNFRHLTKRAGELAIRASKHGRLVNDEEIKIKEKPATKKE